MGGGGGGSGARRTQGPAGGAGAWMQADQWGPVQIRLVVLVVLGLGGGRMFLVGLYQSRSGTLSPLLSELATPSTDPRGTVFNDPVVLR